MAQVSTDTTDNTVPQQLQLVALASHLVRYLLYKGKKVINRGIAYASLYAPNILKAESVRL